MSVTILLPAYRKNFEKGIEILKEFKTSSDPLVIKFNNYFTGMLLDGINTTEFDKDSLKANKSASISAIKYKVVELLEQIKYVVFHNGKANNTNTSPELTGMCKKLFKLFYKEGLVNVNEFPSEWVYNTVDLLKTSFNREEYYFQLVAKN